jgi:hypothetical protein
LTGRERRSGGHGDRRRGGPGPREQVVDPLDRVVGDAGEDIAQVGLGVEPVEHRGLDQGVEDRGAPTATVGAGEQIILPAQGQGLMARSAVLFVISSRPSWANRQSAGQRDRL